MITSIGFLIYSFIIWDLVWWLEIPSMNWAQRTIVILVLLILIVIDLIIYDNNQRGRKK